MNPILNIKSENHTFGKLANTLLNKNEQVSDDDYATTVFGSQEEFYSKKSYIQGYIYNSVRKKIISTNLIFFKGIENSLILPGENQGDAFGFYMVDYLTSMPLLLVYVDNTETGHTYESAKYNQDTKEYDRLNFKQINAKSAEELMSQVCMLTCKDTTTFK